jgi:hypothetical protein
VVARVRERLSVSKRAAQKIIMERFNLKQLNDVAVKEYYQVDISNTSAALENLMMSSIELGTVLERT